MDTGPRRETARIYKFPPGGQRPAWTRDERRVAEAPRAPATTFGSGWYHDQAIADARDAHAHPSR